MIRVSIRRGRWAVAGVVVLYAAAVGWTLHARTPASPTRPPRPHSVYVMGSSIAQGFRAQPGDNWPRLVAGDDREIRSRVQLVNGSVGATRLLLDAPGLPSYLQREQSVLDTHTATTIVLTDLINDIQAVPHQYNPDVIVTGIRTFVARAHTHGIRVVATTIASYGGYAYSPQQSFSAAGERCRQEVNTALRSGHIVDGVIDFDRVLADPQQPEQLDHAFDSGDHLHPNSAGQHALADAVEQQIRADRL